MGGVHVRGPEERKTIAETPSLKHAFACSALVLVALLALAPALPAQGNDPQGGQQPQPEQKKPQRTQPVVVTATRTAQDPFDIPYSTSTIDSFDIRTRRQSRTAPESLKEVPGVVVQKTAHGQGSPKIRGQTGFQTLLLVDGIRINDSTWRSGNNEYWNHVDPFSFSRFEILRGPSSVLWGSDAVSGVGHGFQKGREDFSEHYDVDRLNLVRYASAEDSWVYRAEVQGNAGPVFGWHAGFTYRTFGDLEAGEDVGELTKTGYRDRDGDVKLTFNLSDTQTLSFAMEQNHLKDVPRTHSTVNNFPWRGITPGSDLAREHDHRRQLYYARYELQDAVAFDRMTATCAWKNRYESEARIRSSGVRQVNELWVDTLGLTAQFEQDTGVGTLVYGVDWYHDFVDSSFSDFNPDGSPRSSRNRGVVAGEADYDLLGIYAQHNTVLSDQLELLLGLRWSYALLSADDVDVPGDLSTRDNLSDNWNSVTGNVRMLWKPSATVRLFGGWSQSFRAPNLSDTTRFDAARTNEVEIPATGLDPEFYNTFEVGTRFDDGVFQFEGAAWYTLARDQISRFRTGRVINGQAEVSKANVGDGWYAGFELEGAWTLSTFGWEDWQLYGFFAYVDARIDQINDAGVEVHDRPKAMPPPNGVVGLRWQHPVKELGAEIYSQMAYHVHESRYTEPDRNNTQRIPPNGLPGWATVNVRGWYRIHESVMVSAALENLNDVDYRIMDSGLQEPGRNLIVTVQLDF
jgi:hemoglobin/transferrin/lactoferrin receptor protein